MKPHNNFPRSVMTRKLYYRVCNPKKYTGYLNIPIIISRISFDACPTNIYEAGKHYVQGKLTDGDENSWDSDLI